MQNKYKTLFELTKLEQNGMKTQISFSSFKIKQEIESEMTLSDVRNIEKKTLDLNLMN